MIELFLVLFVFVGVYLLFNSQKNVVGATKLSEKVYGQEAEPSNFMEVVEVLNNSRILFPDYYAQESGIYYNPATNKLKLAGPKTRLTSLRKLGYTEYVGEL